jgi:hypothetical protein
LKLFLPLIRGTQPITGVWQLPFCITFPWVLAFDRGVTDEPTREAKVREVLILDIKPISGVPTLREDGDSPPKRLVDIKLHSDTQEATPASP